MRPRRSLEEAQADTNRDRDAAPEEVVPRFERTDNQSFRRAS
jgi:hypothetical protein